MRVADYIIQFLEEKGIKCVFVITGGGSIHLNDALGQSTKIHYCCNLHEQACVFAAEGYARQTFTPGVCMVTTGPGSTNAITGVYSAWVDSIPLLVISGQVKRSMINRNPKLRQLGDQEINIIKVVSSITKYAVEVEEPQWMRLYLEKCWYFMTTDRPGPVWLSVPFDVQETEIDPKDIIPFDLTKIPRLINPNNTYKFLLQTVKTLLNKAQRPLIIIGKGIHLAKAETVLLNFLKKNPIPIITSLTGMDLVPEEYGLFVGREGVIGQRRGNFILQNADVVLCLGTRLNVRMVSYNPEQFAPNAIKIVVDIDPEELTKPLTSIDIPICANVKDFLTDMMDQLDLNPTPRWNHYIHTIKTKYPIKPIPVETPKNTVDLNYAIYEISKIIPPRSIIVSANGTVSVAIHQMFQVKQGQRIIVNSGCASMGYALPAAIGASFNRDDDQMIYCFEGDGSLQMNLQELQVLFAKSISKFKLIVINNEGYLSIKETQKGLCNNRRMGSDLASLGLLDSKGNSQLFDLYDLCKRDRHHYIASKKDLDENLPLFLTEKCEAFELIVDPENSHCLKVGSYRDKYNQLKSQPLQNMSPLLHEDEVEANMILKPQ